MTAHSRAPASTIEGPQPWTPLHLQMHTRFCRRLAEALQFFDIPPVHSGPFVEAIASIIIRYAPTAADRTHLSQVAEAIVVYGREFYDVLIGVGAISAPRRL